MMPLAFIDVETTGLDPTRHEIVEIGVVRVRGDTLAEIDRTDVRIRPQHLDRADPSALALNGYSEGAWENATDLAEALDFVAPLLGGAIMAGHNVSFDRGFLDASWSRTGVRPPEMDHHVVDTATLAWPLLACGLIPSVSLKDLCPALGMDRGDAHRALADARCSLQVARRLLPDVGLTSRVRALAADEREIVESILARIDAGRSDYGAWDSGDGRDYPAEALAEVIDALNYCGAELVRLRRAGRLGGMRTRRVYVCHPFADDPEGNARGVLEICRALTDSGFLPVAPQVYLPQFLDEASERDRALSLCLALVGACDEVRVYGGRITSGMRREIEYAEARGIPVRFADAEATG